MAIFVAQLEPLRTRQCLMMCLQYAHDATMRHSDNLIMPDTGFPQPAKCTLLDFITCFSARRPKTGQIRGPGIQPCSTDRIPGLHFPVAKM